MKHVMSISLGSTKRNFCTQANIAGQICYLERIGTNGDVKAMKELFHYYAGMVDAFGLGGTDLYLYAGKNRYTFHQSKEIIACAGNTPVFDGSGLKNTLEPYVLDKLQQNGIIDLQDAEVLLVCGTDRFGMADYFYKYAKEVVFGDLMFGLSLPLPIRNIKSLGILAQIIAPIITKMPVRWFYPVGTKQDQQQTRFAKYFLSADIIAGDFHFIRRYMPDELPGKIIITNTVTDSDKELLRAAKAKLLVTTTPNFNGRSFGTNLLEAALFATKGLRCDAGGITDQIIKQAGIDFSIFYL